MNNLYMGYEDSSIKKELPKNVDEAVEELINKGNTDAAIGYLRKNKDDITVFCYKVFKSYREGDKTGLIQLGIIIEKLL